MKSFKPMLASKCEDIAKLRYPLLASVKLDGVRAIVIGGRVMSRSLKPIPNESVQRRFSGLPEGTDGELICGDPAHKDAYRKTVSAVMREEGEPDVDFHMFDNYTTPLMGFIHRYETVKEHAFRIQSIDVPGIPGALLVPHSLVRDQSELEMMEEIALDKGYEGLMVRSLEGPYKFGRSSVKEGYLLKIKRFLDAEAVIESVYEYQTNNNVATTNALGRTERSSHKANKVGAGVLGGLNVRALNGNYKDVEFSIGTGFDGADDKNGERGLLWRDRDVLIGKIVKFKYFPSGSKDRPRFPVFHGFRDARDL